MVDVRHALQPYDVSSYFMKLVKYEVFFASFVCALLFGIVPQIS